LPTGNQDCFYRLVNIKKRTSFNVVSSYLPSKNFSENKGFFQQELSNLFLEPLNFQSTCSTQTSTAFKKLEFSLFF
jgi:hypothetical protein